MVLNYPKNLPKLRQLLTSGIAVGLVLTTTFLPLFLPQTLAAGLSFEAEAHTTTLANFGGLAPNSNAIKNSGRWPERLYPALQQTLQNMGKAQANPAAQLTTTVGQASQLAENKLAGAANDNYGYAVALSGDGNTALIGAYNKTLGANNGQGVAFVYARTGQSWLLQQTLSEDAAGATNDNFGSAVALSENGNTALIGAYRKPVGANKAQGAAFVFVRNGTSWTQQQELVQTPSTAAANNNFGISVALSSDGNTALLGASGQTVGANRAEGAVFSFKRNGTNWGEAQELVEPAGIGTAGDGFGISASLSADGKTALIGVANKTITSKLAQGAAFIFNSHDTNWFFQQELTENPAVGNTSDYFGTTVALSGDGNTALVGAYNKQIGANSGQGAAFVFTRNKKSWQQEAELTETTGTGAVNDQFGYGVALSYNGNTALIGANSKTINGLASQGTVFVLTRNDTNWLQKQALTEPPDTGGDHDFFGFALALSNDGKTGLVGASGQTVNGASSEGAAFIFNATNGSWSQVQELVENQLAANDNDTFGFSLALSGDGNTAVVGADNKKIGANAFQGVAFIYIRSGSKWYQQQLLLEDPAIAAAGDIFGGAVAISGDGNTVLVGAALKSFGANSQQGAVFVYVRNGTNWSQQRVLLEDATIAAGYDRFGSAVALSADGNIALIGASGKNNFQGAAFIFRRSETNWSQSQELTESNPANAAGSIFGSTVALTPDGNTALIGAPAHMVGTVNLGGEVFIFTSNGTSLVQTGQLTDPTPASGAKFGFALSLAADGKTALVGAPTRTVEANSQQGAAFIFTQSGGNWSLAQTLVEDKALALAADNYGNSVALSSDGAIAIVGAPGARIGMNFGAVFSYNKAGTGWNLTQLRVTDTTVGQTASVFGQSLALSGNNRTLLVGAGNSAFGLSIANCNTPFIVTDSQDDGQGTTCGSLSYALSQTTDNASPTVTFDLDSGVNTVFLSKALTLPQRVTLDGGNGIILDGQGLNIDVLTLTGHDTLIHLIIQHFKGRPLALRGPGNILRQVQVQH
jgi:hypothetical protein